jgi:hypothetical protein
MSEKKYFFLVSYTAQGTDRIRNGDIVFDLKDNYITKKCLSQMRDLIKLERDCSIVFTSISRLGHMTEEEYNE